MADKMEIDEDPPGTPEADGSSEGKGLENGEPKVEKPLLGDKGKGKGKGKGGVDVPVAQGVDILKRQAELATQAALPWVEKYRPNSLDELVAHEDIVAILNRLIESNKLPHLLFYGPPGTGKTSTIMACAKKMYGKHYGAMVLELNASDDRGINVVREQIKEFAGTQRLFSSGVKLVILDEADSMTNDAQFALRRVIEKHTRHTRFCMICNYVSKIIPALQSRCTKFRFAPLKEKQIESRLQYVVDEEKVDITEGGKAAILRLGQGDMRRVMNLLQSTHMAFDKVDETNTYLCAASPLVKDMETILTWVMNSNFKEAFDNIADMTKTKGYALNDVLSELTRMLIDIEMPAHVMAGLMDSLSNIEYRLSYGCNDLLQLGALVGTFVTARHVMTLPSK